MWPQHAAPIEAVLRRRVELGVLADGVTFSVGAVFGSPFRVPNGTLIEISPTVAHSGPALAIHIRHALEIAMWHRLVPPPRSIVTELAVSALACWTASQYIDTLPSCEAAAAVDALPAWLRQLRRLAREHDEGGDRAAVAAELVTLGSHLLDLQGATRRGVALDREALAQAADVTTALMEAALPTEVLLTRGGDSRVSLEATARVNKYGCSAVPRPSTVSFSSCTASSPSELSYRAAEHTRQELIGSVLHGTTMADRFGAAIEEVRSELASVIGLDARDRAQVMLAASGTDCELCALQLALEGHDRDLLVIVIGPDEIGGGSLSAASGRYFDALTPLERPVPVGKPLDGLEVGRVHTETVPLRERSGRPVPIGDIDAKVEALAREAVGRGARVLLHVVDSSKTGLRAPSIGAVRKLHHELGEALIVVVDAAQMRTRCETLIEYVRAGWLVMISGSKFFAGPPFAGALLVPPAFSARATNAAAVPLGLGAYLSAFDVPRPWVRWRASFQSTPNLGLLLRWRSALAEMHAFEAFGRDARRERVEAISRHFRSELGRRRFVEIVAAPVADRNGVEESWDGCQTIWTFVLKRDRHARAERRVLSYDEAWQVYIWLNRDVSAMLPSQATMAERSLAAVRCHIGQPVRIGWGEGDVAGALRLALGARSMRESTLDPGCVLDKIEVILRYWRQLTAQPAVA
jgi:hypothetical protein